MATGLEKASFHSNPKEATPKNVQTTTQLALISHVSKEMLKILQAKPQEYLNQELPDIQAGFRKARGTRDQMSTSVGS